MEQQLAQICARLRALRRTRNLTLTQIEQLTQGRLHAVSLGSYERGDRAISVKKALEIADFYEVPLAYLLTGKSEERIDALTTTIDLRRLRTLSQRADNPLTLTMILSFIAGIIKARQDFNGEVLSLRDKDCEYLTISIGCTYAELRRYLVSNALLISLN